MRSAVTLVASVILAVATAGCGALGSTASPQPSGMALQLKTASSRSTGCPTAALLPVEMVVNGDSVQFISQGTGKAVDVEWPPGFYADLANGVGTVHSNTGDTIAVQGDVLTDLSGGLSSDGSFAVCAKDGHQL